jgi:hypothetical protein
MNLKHRPLDYAKVELSIPMARKRAILTLVKICFEEEQLGDALPGLNEHMNSIFRTLHCEWNMKQLAVESENRNHGMPTMPIHTRFSKMPSREQ